MLEAAKQIQHPANSNDTRLGGLGEIKLGTRWLEHMSIANRLYFDRRAEELNRRIGYEPRRHLETW